MIVKIVVRDCSLFMGGGDGARRGRNVKSVFKHLEGTYVVVFFFSFWLRGEAYKCKELYFVFIFTTDF